MNWQLVERIQGIVSIVLLVGLGVLVWTRCVASPSPLDTSALEKSLQSVAKDVKTALSRADSQKGEREASGAELFTTTGANLDDAGRTVAREAYDKGLEQSGVQVLTREQVFERVRRALAALPGAAHSSSAPSAASVKE